MEKFVKIRRPYSLAEFRLKKVNEKQYLECLVVSKDINNATEIECFATQTATQQILDIVRSVEAETGCCHTVGGNGWYRLDPLILCWLTVNEKGHTVSYVRKE